MALSDFIKKVAPFGGRMLGADANDRKKMAPIKQTYGGSQEALDKQRAAYEKMVGATGRRVDSGVTAAQQTASDANSQNAGVLDRMNSAQVDLRRDAASSGAGFERQMHNYNDGRGRQLAGAGQLERMASEAPSRYQETAQAAFAAQQDANARQGQALAAQGGAAGLRTAMATQAAGNASAQQQAGITQANEQNQLLQMQQSAVANAANIRSGVAGQDQSAAGLYSTRQQNANTTGAGLLTAEGNVVNANAGVGLNAAGLETQAGVATQGQVLNARQGMEGSQLDANREHEGARQANEKATYTNDWFPLKKFNAPA